MALTAGRPPAYELSGQDPFFWNSGWLRSLLILLDGKRSISELAPCSCYPGISTARGSS
jgi:hypothetical protein